MVGDAPAGRALRAGRNVSGVLMRKPIEIRAGGRRGWLAAGGDGHPVGVGWLDGEPNAPATLSIDVHPTDRRQGVGSSLLAEALAAARELGCPAVQCDPVDQGTPGDLFLTHHGFSPALELAFTHLDLTGAAAPQAPPVPGYRLVTWWGTVPDELAEAFAAARPAMDDMPMGDVPLSARPWDVARLHAVAQAVADRGEHLLTVAAVHEATSELAAFTELVVPATGDGEAEHYGTAVVPAHRGRGLARWIKTETISEVRERFPAVRSLLADTAAENHAMRRVNASLGYEDSHRSTYYRLELRGPAPA